MTIKVLGGQKQRKKMNRVKFKLAPFNSSDDDHAVLINAWTINSVFAPLAAVEVDVKKCDHLRNLQLPDIFPREASSVYLLVGADQDYKSVQEHRLRLNQDLVGFRVVLSQGLRRVKR